MCVWASAFGVHTHAMTTQPLPEGKRFIRPGPAVWWAWWLIGGQYRRAAEWLIELRTSSAMFWWKWREDEGLCWSGGGGGGGMCVRVGGGGKTARCFNEAFVLVYSRCACADGLLWLCVTALPLSLPLSAGRLNIDKTQTDPNVSSNHLTLPKTQNSGL